MAVQVFATQPINDVGESIRLLIEVGRVDLTDVARQNDLGVFARPRDDGFDLVGGEVLGLIDDENDIGQRPASDVGQGRNLDFAIPLHVFDGAVLPLVGPKLALDELQVVKQRLHVGIDLLLCVAWEKAQIFVAEGHDGPGQNDLVEALVLFECPGQGQQGLARACHTTDGHEVHVGVLDGVQCEGLL